MAATYSRGIYKTTTIGNAAFDGRVRNGIGSDHSFKATKNQKSEARGPKSEILPELAPTVRLNFKRTSALARGTEGDPAFL